MSEGTILCIDDDVAALAGLVERFEEAGYAVLRATDVDHGYLLFEEDRPDLVTLEVALQHGRGWKLLDTLAAAGARVMVVTSNGLVENVVRGLKAGAVEYICKPYRTDELLARAQLRLQQAVPARPAPEQPQAEPFAAGPEQPQAEPFGAGPEQPQAEPFGAEPEQPQGSMTAPEEEFGPAPAASLVPLPADQAREEQSLNLGPRLRAARRLRNISLVQAELETRIRMYYIQALEEERYALLPRGASTERIIRGYATFLGVDPQQALEEYHSRYHSDDEPQHDLGGGGELEEVAGRWRPLLWLIAALLALLLTVGSLYYLAPGELLAIWDNLYDLIFSS